MIAQTRETRPTAIARRTAPPRTIAPLAAWSALALLLAAATAQTDQISQLLSPDHPADGISEAELRVVLEQAAAGYAFSR